MLSNDVRISTSLTALSWSHQLSQRHPPSSCLKVHTMQTIQTLTDFLNASNVSFRLFDMGRRVTKLSSETFCHAEQARIPYPLPYLKHAWIGILLWNPKQTDQQIIWFLKLPLDEQGLLVQSARDDFLHRLARCVGDQLLDKAVEQDSLKDNPFAFTPDQDKMAAFHAKAGLILRQPPSAFYQPTRDYLSGLRGYDAWQNLGIQGIADLCSRLELDSNDAVLIHALDKLPLQPLTAFAAQLEHQPIPHPLGQQLSRRLHRELETDSCSPGTTQPGTLAALLRGLSHCHSDELRHNALRAVLQSSFGTDLEILAAIASRCWQDLQDTGVCNDFLEALAGNEAGQPAFNQIITELVFIPGMRAPIMDGLRNPDRSDALAMALGGFFGQAKR